MFEEFDYCSETGEAYSCFKELVVDLQQTWQLHADLQHGGRDKSHIPVESTDFLLQELHQELCNHSSALVNIVNSSGSWLGTEAIAHTSAEHVYKTNDCLCRRDKFEHAG